jgi:hypothetical protein
MSFSICQNRVFGGSEPVHYLSVQECPHFFLLYIADTPPQYVYLYSIQMVHWNMCSFSLKPQTISEALFYPCEEKQTWLYVDSTVSLVTKRHLFADAEVSHF